MGEKEIPRVQVDLSRVDWELLRRQKEFLLSLMPAGTPDKDEYAEGLVSLLDSIQDQAATQLGEGVVFGKKAFRVVLNAVDSDGKAFYIGEWGGEAFDEAEAKRKAMDRLWDSRLDGLCSPSFAVEEVDIDQVDDIRQDQEGRRDG